MAGTAYAHGRLRSLKGLHRGSFDGVVQRFFPTFYAKVHGQRPPAHKNPGGRSGASELITQLDGMARAGIPIRAAWERIGIPVDAQDIPFAVALKRHLQLSTLRSSVPIGHSPRKPSVEINRGQFSIHKRLGGGGPQSQGKEQSDHQVVATILVISRIAHHSGISLIALLNTVQESLDNALEAHEHRRIALAGPASSAAILQLLPLLGIGAGLLIGVNSFRWMVASPSGVLCGAVGTLFLVAGRKWTGKLISRAAEDTVSASPSQVSNRPVCARVRRKRLARICVHHSPQVLPFGVVIDLVNALLASGSSIPKALTTVGTALGDHEGSQLQNIGRALQLGATWRTAWESCPDRLRPLEGALFHSWEFGAPAAQSLRLLRETAERESLTRAKEQAEKLGVQLALPLGACFLPSFVLLAVVPIIVAMASELM